MKFYIFYNIGYNGLVIYVVFFKNKIRVYCILIAKLDFIVYFV